MPTLSVKQTLGPLYRASTVGTSSKLPSGPVVACVDTSDLSDKVTRHALAVAEALGVPVAVLHVLEVAQSGERLPDPIKWGIRRREACDQVERLASQRGKQRDGIASTVVEGQPAEQICQWARRNDVGLIVAGTHGHGDVVHGELGATARRLVDRLSAPILLVPASASGAADLHYRRILVPLDGSSRAESALPLALRLAEAEGAEVVLAHVVPTAELTEIGPFEQEDLELLEEVMRRNERVARQYLERVHARLADRGVDSRTILVRDRDARNRLVRIAAEEEVDLIVLSAHGQSGRVDVPCGSVASYILTHAATPLVLVPGGRRSSDRCGAQTRCRDEQLVERTVL
jgi:nucleotide-binding universal stress UspA family protein